MIYEQMWDMIIFCIGASFLVGVYVGYGLKDLFKKKKKEKTIWEEILGW